VKNKPHNLMKITLYLFFNTSDYGNSVLLKKQWPIADHDSPFWRKDEETEQWIFGYPSSGDIHKVKPAGKDSHFTLLIKSHQTDTFEKVIWAEVIQVIESKTNGVVLIPEEDIIKELHKDHWEDASNKEEKFRFCDMMHVKSK